MTDLMKFYKEFTAQKFVGVNQIRNEHTLYLCIGSLIVGKALEYVVSHCPANCRYFVSVKLNNETGFDVAYICVYDD